LSLVFCILFTSNWLYVTSNDLSCVTHVFTLFWRLQDNGEKAQDSIRCSIYLFVLFILWSAVSLTCYWIFNSFIVVNDKKIVFHKISWICIFFLIFFKFILYSILFAKIVFHKISWIDIFFLLFSFIYPIFVVVNLQYMIYITNNIIQWRTHHNITWQFHRKWNKNSNRFMELHCFVFNSRS
jgi:hypothetical protein